MGDAYSRVNNEPHSVNEQLDRAIGKYYETRIRSQSKRNRRKILYWMIVPREWLENGRSRHPDY